MKELLKALLSKTLNIDDSKFDDLVKIDKDGKVEDGVLDSLLGLDKARIKTIDDTHNVALGERHKNGLSQGKKETLDIFEKDLKTKFDFKSDSKGIELINEIIISKAKPGETIEMTTEQIQVSKTYLDGIEAVEKTKVDAVADALKPLQEQIQGFERAGSLNIVNRVANGIIDSLNPRFSDDKVKASNQRNVILDTLATLNFKVEGERITLLNDKDELLVDEHKNPIKFEERVKSVTTNLYDLKESTERKGGGPDDDPEDGDDPKPFKWNGQTPKDFNEYTKLVSEADSPKEKKEILESWHASQYAE